MTTTKNRQETSYYKDEDASVVERNRDAGHLEELHDAMSVSEKPAHRWTLDTTIVEQKDTLSYSMLLYTFEIVRHVAPIDIWVKHDGKSKSQEGNVDYQTGANRVKHGVQNGTWRSKYFTGSAHYI